MNVNDEMSGSMMEEVEQPIEEISYVSDEVIISFNEHIFND